MSVYDLNQVALDKAEECKIQTTAYSIWLNKLRPANFTLVIGGAILSLIAGSSLLLDIDTDVLDPKIAGVLAIISAAFTIIHTKLNCDEHQAECRKLKGQYAALSQAYNDLTLIKNEAELKNSIEVLNAERLQIIKGTTSEPSPSAFEKAKKKVRGC